VNEIKKESFIKALCLARKINSVNWLWDNSHIDMHSFTNTLFEYLVKEGTIELLKIFLEKRNISSDELNDVIKVIPTHAESPEILIELHKRGFKITDEHIVKFIDTICKYKNIETRVHVLISLVPDIHYSKLNQILVEAKQNSVVILILNYIHGKITDEESIQIFKGLCFGDAVVSAKYMYIKFDIANSCDIKDNDHEFFKKLCKHNSKKCAKWIIELFPDTYSLAQKKLCITPIIFIKLKKIKIDHSDTCSICGICETNCSSNCGHAFCYTCLNTLFNTSKKCPICTSDINNCYVTDES
jgi:hypothetical protein